jgi:hypothetical protein
MSAGRSSTAASGIAAPTTNVAAEAIAAWMGHAFVTSLMPGSSRACAPGASSYVAGRPVARIRPQAASGTTRQSALHRPRVRCAYPGYTDAP